ncbi:MAG: hypothetical protein ISR72_10260 [Methylobacter sp.]|nr:hypothetical protein [Methylobacter sp.]
MKLFLDWSAYQNAGMGDAYADTPKRGGDFAKAVAVCIGSCQCEQGDKGVMCPSYKVTGNPTLSPGGRVKLLKSALNASDEKALSGPELAEAMRKVLKSVNGLDFKLIEASCCGMAGHFGLEAEHYAVSQAMAELALFPSLREEPEAAIVANGFSCQQQIANGGFNKPRHIAQILYSAATQQESL